MLHNKKNIVKYISFRTFKERFSMQSLQTDKQILYVKSGVPLENILNNRQ